MKQPAILLKNVSVHYKIGHQQLRDIFSRHKKSDNFVALSNINLNIKYGERVALIGANGAGKSTLLKVMSGIYQPAYGTVKIRGRVSPLFEMASGFEAEMTGWNNIRVRCLLLGMSRQETETKIHEIAEFTELGEFLNYPVRTYSAGMFIRLAFAVSTAVHPEILLLDEVMGTGDAKFIEKSKLRLEEFIEKGSIVIFSSHSAPLIKQYCSRTIWLDHGKIMLDGETDKVMDAYLEWSQANVGA